MNIPLPLTKIYITFVDYLCGYSPIGESSMDFRQYISEKFANWRTSSELSSICPMEIRQLAKVQWTFVSVSHGNSPIIAESLIGEVPEPRNVVGYFSIRPYPIVYGTMQNDRNTVHTKRS
ncbi:unnamed protein product [Rotaria magnacalcarata]|uniref:Uncharacterized protein n=1 Tax=Rotaria magnacalcarata TaxID=392030 RepID=A0A815SKY8_9BILA|nr:unnamed protein product [Rotaria magnacalcarata]CAF4329052.1 unnamed protein product [Rotaria magnacalcarata]